MMWSHEIDTWIVIIGVLCAMACALLGNFLVLRRMSMMGDAISHAVLPGLAAGYLLTGSRTSVVMFIGAVVVGVLTALFTQWVHGFGQVDRGAAMGVVFTSLFAMGLIMIVRAADHVDLDPSCVLYGAVELAPLDISRVGPFQAPRAVFVLGAVLLFNTLAVLMFYKELKISSFDPALATSLGINAKVMHYLLMVLVAVTTVASFEAIGSILVIAMLIVPAATARLWTDRLGSMIAVSLVVAAGSAAMGHLAAITVPTWFGFTDTTTSGMVASTAGVIFVMGVFFAPRHGLLMKWWHRLGLHLRIVKEDVLGLMFRVEERNMEQPAVVAVGLMLQVLGVRAIVCRLALSSLCAGGKIHRVDGGGYHLTRKGRVQAASLVRAHRLWESYLDKYLPLPSDHLHAPAERLEHITSPEIERQLDAAVHRPTHDPHGQRVPPRATDAESIR